ncbi:TetR/AcrR family transcriptional regulator [Mycobacterium sp.]|uniref:TetR/AcrR family transcriptional regulator n=1 Tax=Mycobacterium sp. TaxID=1785 RepID=UPI003A86BD4B
MPRGSGGRDWLAERRTEIAADRILDAAGALFADRDPTAIGMNEIARAAGCSRATLYRYFDSREALRTAFVHREARRLGKEILSGIEGIADPADRLIAGILTSLRAVRENPALAAWFGSTRLPIGGELAAQSEVITALAAGFLSTVKRDLPPVPDQMAGHTDPAALQRHARWTVRVIVSLLMFPGTSDADEQALIAEFVAPVLTLSRT